ncbi:GNAT family N-acetyltransferase [Mesorhizobium sp. CAU 1741]|uniref:GNAT family N-acetyltransferase n=1 Tax=Mesorhizobium sp. CAU 1741 TaxID=3140366 RepID=UPI00325BE532
MTADGPVATLPAGYSIRPHRRDDDRWLLKVENRAAALFREHGYPQIADNPLASLADFRAMLEGHQCWVVVDDASRLPVGYAVAGPRGEFLHLREISVDPGHGRKGLGASLVRHVIQEARRGRHRGVSLTTFRYVPFNAPFYARRDFSVLPWEEAPSALRETFLSELPAGVAAWERVLMLHSF